MTPLTGDVDLEVSVMLLKLFNLQFLGAHTIDHGLDLHKNSLILIYLPCQRNPDWWPSKLH